jgi:hypothetical protein
LKTFSSLKKGTVIKRIEKGVMLKAVDRVFGHILLVAQNLKKNGVKVGYPLGLKLCALGNAHGTLKKTVKANLGIHIEKQTVFVDLPTGPRALVIDAMEIIRKFMEKIV